MLMLDFESKILLIVQKLLNVEFIRNQTPSEKRYLSSFFQDNWLIT